MRTRRARVHARGPQTGGSKSAVSGGDASAGSTDINGSKLLIFVL